MRSGERPPDRGRGGLAAGVGCAATGTAAVGSVALGYLAAFYIGVAAAACVAVAVTGWVTALAALGVALSSPRREGPLRAAAAAAFLLGGAAVAGAVSLFPLALAAG